MRIATAAAGGLAIAAVVMGVLAFTTGGDGEEQVAAPPTATPAAPPASGRTDTGLAVWAAQGCGSCHTFAPAGATATIGPNLGNSLGGRSRAYIRESIVAPNARVPGGGTSIMPEGFGKRISKPELDALVTFITEGVRAH